MHKYVMTLIEFDTCLSNDTIANVVLDGLELNFQVHKFEI